MSISVAMATWNGERFIGEQLESIARQSRLPDELVISDDGSSDRTLEIAAEFKSWAPFDVVVLRNDQRLGYAENFFRAMAACSGDLIAFCDQDDVWAPEKLTLCVEPFHSDHRVSLVAHAATVCDEALCSLGWSNPTIDTRRLLEPGSLPPFSGYSAFALVLRSVFVERAEPYRRPASFFPGEGSRIDHGVWASLVCPALGSVALLPDRLALYRRHDANTSVTGRDSRKEQVKRSLTLRGEDAIFAMIARAVYERLAYLESLRILAEDLGDYATRGLDRTLHSYRHYANAMENRAAAYRKTHSPARFSQVLLNAMHGDYGSRAKGGLGVASLARDLAIGTLPRR